MDMYKLDYYKRVISLSIEEALMRPDLEFSMNLKKARIKENDAAIERLNEQIVSKRFIKPCCQKSPRARPSAPEATNGTREQTRTLGRHYSRVD